MAIQLPEDDPYLASRAKRDLDDLNAELTGMETGRQQRFLAGDKSVRAVEERKRKEEEQAFQSLLEMLLRENARYARLYNEVKEQLARTEQAVDAHLHQVEQERGATAQRLRRIREGAATLPNGARVFRSSTDGSLYTEDGQRLSAETARGVAIPEGAPTWEEYAREVERSRQLRQEAQDVERYREEVLKPAQERMNDKDNPPSMEELEDLRKQVEAAAPPALAARIRTAGERARPALSAAHSMVSATTLDVPDLGKHFDNARAPARTPQATPLPGLSPTASPV